MEKSYIEKVIEGLNKSVNKSSLNENDKDELRYLINKMYEHYKIKKTEVGKWYNSKTTKRTISYKVASELVEDIVVINDAIIGRNDLDMVVSVLSKKFKCTKMNGKVMIKRSDSHF